MTSVPSIAFGPEGFVAPQADLVLAGVQADISAAFGRNLSYALTTPQGQLASSEAALIVNTNSIFVYYTNQVDPAYASGRMQDAIARINFLQRDPAEPTILQIECLGGVGVAIPLTATVSDAAGNIYQCTEAGTIGVSGTVTLPFASIVVGPVTVPSEVSIYQAIPGWDVATVVSGAIGQSTESSQQFEARRAASVAGNSVGNLAAVQGAVLSVPGVLDAYVTENDEPSIQTVGGFALAPNSLYVAVLGGDPDAVAQAIWRKKMPGCGYNGNVEVIVQDTRAAYSPPYPTYIVKFQAPDPVVTLFAVVLTGNNEVPADAMQQVQAAILAAFDGADGGVRARIGATIYGSRYVAPLVALGTWCQVQSISVGTTNDPSATFQGSIAATTMTVSSVASGTVATGQTVVGLGVQSGTVISGQIDGTPGGPGTYSIAPAQTVSDGVLKSVVAASFSQGIDIDQYPTLDAANIAVAVT